MLNPKTYLRVLFTFLLFIGLLAAGYVYDFSKAYPPPITSRISFDAKLKFIREHIDPDKIDTIIVGSSIGLNNILGSVLEESSKKVQNALNLSVYEATTLEVEQILELSDAFPNLKRILYSAQYSDFPHAKKYDNYNPILLKKFIRNELSSFALSKLLFNACNNVLFCKQRKEKWRNEHLQNDKFTSLLFDHTGSVPLEIYKKEGVGGRWYLPHPGIMHGKSFAAVDRMAKKAQERGVVFYVIHSPYREPLAKKHKSVRDALIYFDDKVKPIVEKYGGKLLSLQSLHLDDQYFADRTHLNVKGSTLVSKRVGAFIDKNEN